MRRVWLIAIASVVFLALGTAGWAWFEYKDRWAPPAPKPPSIPELIVPRAAASAPIVADAIQRPLLWSTRRPIPKEEKKDNAERELTQSTLVAVFQAGAARIAVLKKADGTTTKLSNNSLPWRVDTFDGRRAVFLSDGGKSVEKFLEFKGGGANLPSASPAGATPPAIGAGSGRVNAPTPAPAAPSATGSGPSPTGFVSSGIVPLIQLPGLNMLFPQQQKASNAPKK